MVKITAIKEALKALFKPATTKYPHGPPSSLPPGLRGLPEFDEKKCTGCGACFASCSAGAISLADEGNHRKINIPPMRCIFCGRCEDVCPEEAIALSEKFELATSDKNTALVAIKFDLQTCKDCSAPITTPQQLEKIKERILSEIDPRIKDILAQDLAKYMDLCIECRQRRSIELDTNTRKFYSRGVGGMNLVLGVLILICAVAIVEVSDFRFIPVILGVQGVFYAIEFILEGMWLEVVPLTLFSILVVPILLFLITTKTKNAEERPLIPTLPSITLLVILIIGSYIISVLLSFEIFLFPLVITGAYGLLVKTDLRKSVASLAILFNALHSFTAVFDLLLQIVLTAFSLILLAVLLYFALHIYSLKGSLSTKDLKELRF